MIVGTAGHVDHGKTSLVRALTGVDTDRLPEEKARGISIELGFAYAHLGDPEAVEPIGFIDVPGHRKFVQTMIAGAAGVDVGLLVVAADDGPMLQTREHLDILGWLGVSRVIVALTKVDAVDAGHLTATQSAIMALLDATPYRGAAVLPVSAVTGAGIGELVAALRGERDRLVSSADDSQPVGRFRLSIDRSFVLQGIGLVVTGTCLSGRVAIDDQVVLLPGHATARVRGIHAQNRQVQDARAGQRVALNLAGRGIEKSTVHRGDWAVASSIAIESDRIDVALAPGAPASFNAREWRTVRFHAGASSVNARIVLLEPSAADDPRPSLAQVVFEAPLHVVAGDRFVLRDATATDGAGGGAPGSVAGGTVLDVDVPTRGRRAGARLRFLRVATVGDPRATLVDAVEASAKGVDLVRWNAAHDTAFDASSVPAQAVGSDGHAAGLTLFSHARWDAMLARVVEVLGAEHARTPDAVGPGRDRLRRMAAPSLDAFTFTALVDALKADGRLAQTGAWLHLPEHRVALSDDDRRRFERARVVLDAAADAPPRVRDVARVLGDDEAVVRGLFVRLASLGELYRVAHDHYFLPAAIRRLAAAAAEVAHADGVARAAPFRDRIGVGRKVAIQILEFFDRVGYTRRLGDDHRIIQPSLFDD